MKIDSSKFLAYNIPELMKEELVSLFSKEMSALGTIDNQEHIRANFMRMYLEPSEKTYLLTKSAVKTIQDIKIKDTPAIRNMVLDYADEEATFLINEKEHIKLISRKLDPVFGQRSVIAMYLKLDDSDGRIAYETFNVLESEINHPTYLAGGRVKAIDFFLKMVVFIKCTNVEVEVLGEVGGKKPRRAKIDGEKFINNLDEEVTLVNAKYNKITVRDEEFYVNAHGRFQRYGEKNRKVKYIIIDGYYKSGYKRGFKN